MTQEFNIQVRAYHRLTKHSTKAYAPSPGFLDWDSQPNPFRRYAGAPLVTLPLMKDIGDITGHIAYEKLYQERDLSREVTPATLGQFLELAFGLSAWKTTGMDSWSLRHNPSSGNLHPTETYLLLWRKINNELVPGVYHYAAYEHALELRALIDQKNAESLVADFGGFGALGFSSIHWREEWKYGARALRYCQHDVGHALGAARYSAALFGWQLSVDTMALDADVRACLGLNHSNSDAETEQPDLLAFIGPDLTAATVQGAPWNLIADNIEQWLGSANRISPEHAYWPQIAKVLPALEKTQSVSRHILEPAPVIEISDCERNEIAATRLIHRRRSAQRMVLGAGISKQNFLQILARTMPRADQIPFDAFGFAPAINLIIFVHAVESLAPGLYLLVRTPQAASELKHACKSHFQWQAVADTELPLYELSVPMDFRKTASQLSCYQGIAGHSAFSLGMIANVDRVFNSEGSWSYKRLFWEAGLIGQVLYLEAEGSDANGTGIGCYFDDNVHQLLGLDPEGSWQDLYHFTVGQSREDQRLTTLSGYHHLSQGENL